jgi:hypothetical protein
MAGGSFQSTVNVQLAGGIPGAFYDDSPERSAPWELVSSNAAYNIIGATAYTATTADAGSGIVSGVAAAGGSGQFVGVLSNKNQYANIGTSTGALNPTTALPNYSIGQLTTMGHLWVALPGPANVGDQVCYDQTTGQISTFAKVTSFTGSIVASTGVLTVSAIAAGNIQPGMAISGSGFSCTIVANDSGVGGTGTYYTDYSASAPNVSSEAMSGSSLPPVAASVTGTISTAGLLNVTAVGSGQLSIGSVLTGTGVPANTVITALGTGEGGTGTYTVSPSPAVAVTATTITADAQVKIDRAEVILFQPAGSGGLGVISLTGA